MPRVEQAARYLLGKGAPDLLYGAVVSAAMLAVTSLHAGDGEVVAFATASVIATYWLAHVYVDAVGGRIEDREHHTGQRLLAALRENTGVLLGAVPPLLVFLLARSVGADVTDAALAALVFTVVALVAGGAAAAWLAGARGLALVGEAAISGAFGAVVLGLKLVLH
jgi:hypothetical protein